MQQSNIDHYVRTFYEKQLELLHSGQREKMRAHYFETCASFAKLISVSTQMHEKTEKFLKELRQVIVVANHIPTVEVFAIKDSQFISRFVDDPKVLFRESIRPVIVRHFPLINLLREHQINPHIFTFNPPEPFTSMVDAWGHLHVAHDQPNKFAWLSDNVRSLKKPWGLVIFPEGEDSNDDLYTQRYELRRFRKGFSLLSAQYSVPVLPVSIVYNPHTYSYALQVHDVIKPPHLDQVKEHVLFTQNQIKSGIKNLTQSQRVT